MPPIVPVFPTTPPPRIGAARRRLGRAVAASVVAHGALMMVLPADLPRRGGDAIAARPLTVNLAVAALPPAGIEPRHGEPVRERIDARPPPEPASRAVPVASAGSGDAARVPGEALAAAPAPLVAEPAYFPANELDIFPRLSEPLASGEASPRGMPGRRMRLELLIGADGAVREVVVLESDASGDAAAAAREMWLTARFDPARKAGRAVASRIRLEVAYGPAGGVR